MVVFSLYRIAIGALWANKLRTSLTLLGVIIGVTSIMTIISALEGMMGAIEGQLDRMGPSTFIITRLGMITSDEQWREAMKRKPLSLGAIDQIEKECDACEKVCPRAYRSATVKAGSRSLRNVMIGGSTYNMIDIVDFEVSEGRFHSPEDDLYRRQVAFVGAFIKEDLFEGLDPIGKYIRIGGNKYKIIGVAKKQGAMFGNNPDNFVIIPFSVHVKQFGVPRRSMNIMVKAYDVASLNEAQDQIRVILRSRRHVPYNKPDDFSILTADNILETINSITRVFRLGLIGISSISIVVGGIVVMNIMMVSVTERTREIGIRKAIGARRRHIMLQFLFEALTTTLGGGLIGIVIGFLLARMLVGMIDMEISPSALAIFAGLSISTGTGLIFGIYPAMKAARLDPIKALSYE